MAHDPCAARSRAQCAVQKAALRKMYKTYNGGGVGGGGEGRRYLAGRYLAWFKPYDCQPRKNLHTASSVNKPKLSVIKHDQTLIQLS